MIRLIIIITSLHFVLNIHAQSIRIAEVIKQNSNSIHNYLINKQFTLESKSYGDGYMVKNMFFYKKVSKNFREVVSLNELSTGNLFMTYSSTNAFYTTKLKEEIINLSFTTQNTSIRKETRTFSEGYRKGDVFISFDIDENFDYSCHIISIEK